MARAENADHTRTAFGLSRTLLNLPADCCILPAEILGHVAGQVVSGNVGSVTGLEMLCHVSME